ncbi:hypothetical protein LWI28_028165 [Acer negundo]|uniref:Uncharacterized protein n=1 Tax=Acer negundo TaxID=4023 RepID=A0AAD5NGC3_ACENE|nr:hypothetical protein LWI28_028165 [Acer negundo]
MGILSTEWLPQFPACTSFVTASASSGWRHLSSESDFLFLYNDHSRITKRTPFLLEEVDYGSIQQDETLVPVPAQLIEQYVLLFRQPHRRLSSPSPTFSRPQPPPGQSP